MFEPSPSLYMYDDMQNINGIQALPLMKISLELRALGIQLTTEERF